MKKVTEGISENMKEDAVMYLLDMHLSHHTAKVKRIQVIRNVHSQLVVRNMCRLIILSRFITQHLVICTRHIMY